MQLWRCLNETFITGNITRFIEYGNYGFLLNGLHRNGEIKNNGRNRN